MIDFLTEPYGDYGYDLATPPDGYVDYPAEFIFQATVAAGQIITGLPLTSQYDAPFIAKGVAIGGLTGPANSFDNNLFIRYTDADQMYLSNQSATFTAGGPAYQAAGSLMFPRPIVPNFVIPPGGVILVDVLNASGAPNSFQLVFRGVKRYRELTPLARLRGWLDRYKEFRLSIITTSGQDGADNFLALDDDADFHWIGVKAEWTPTGVPDGLAFGFNVRFFTNSGYSLEEVGLDETMFNTAGSGEGIYTFAAPIRIPAGGRINVDLKEVLNPGGAGDVVRFTFVGIKRYSLD